MTLDKARHATNFNACGTTRSWERPPDGFRASGLLVVTARHLTPSAVGRFEIWGTSTTPADFPYYDLVELAEGGADEGMLQLRYASRRLTVPPFGDLGGIPETWQPERTTIIELAATDFFGGPLRWWIAVSGDDVVAGALGEPPSTPDVTLAVDYPTFLDARLGGRPWRQALTSGQWRVEGSLPDILHAATIAQGLTTPDEPLAPQLRWALEVCNHLAPHPPDPAPPLIADPVALWPNIDPWTSVDLIQVALAGQPPLLVGRAWVDSHQPSDGSWFELDDPAALDVPGLRELPTRKLRLELDGTWTDGWDT